MLYEYVDENPVKGGVKDVYFSPDRKYVVAFYRTPLENEQKERIKRIVSTYLVNIQLDNWFLNSSGKYLTRFISATLPKAKCTFLRLLFQSKNFHHHP